jgi:hypothetical protein
MRSVVIDFNSRDKDGNIAVRLSRLSGAYCSEPVNVIDPDGELVAQAVVSRVTPSYVVLNVIKSTIRDRPTVSHPLVGRWAAAGEVGARTERCDHVHTSSTSRQTLAIGLLPAPR